MSGIIESAVETKRRRALAKIERLVLTDPEYLELATSEPENFEAFLDLISDRAWPELRWQLEMYFALYPLKPWPMSLPLFVAASWLGLCDMNTRHPGPTDLCLQWLWPPKDGRKSVATPG